ncbi:Protein of unknown function [Pedobacter terrae]|uniref:DUF3667 domain-containing protein n=1 Tax=Pedobacter terrae TaxID=405671 RepID=A0A1G7X8C4_9SPHI|nr:DUF3667 domain-containing protein [Pedobacter terrae]SDG80432.1 Protein of unknown function [Pedobacter terrae]
MKAICISCNQDIPENYCTRCGEPATLKRIDWHYIQHEIEHILHLEKGIFYTVKELLIRPGRTIHNFISNDRSRLVKPVIFVIITSLIYTLVNHFFNIEKGYFNFDQTGTAAINPINDWIQSHYGYANIILGVFLSLWLKLFFRKYGYNFFELLILLCFLQGMGMLMFTIFAAIEGITHTHLLQYSGMLFIVYFSWAVGQFFEKSKYINYLKALGVYIFGVITFTVCIFILGILIHTITKH